MPGQPEASRSFDWTVSPAKWGAVILLAALGGSGLTWSILRSSGGLPSGRTAGPARAPSRPPPPIPEDGTFLVGDDGSIIASGFASQAAPTPSDDPAPPPDVEFGPPLPSALPEQPAAAHPAAQPTDQPTTPPPAPSTPEQPGIGQTINLNTATEAQLQLLPAIGPARARAIIEDRAARGPFRSIDDLDRVQGIGPAIIEGLRRFARVS